MMYPNIVVPNLCHKVLNSYSPDCLKYCRDKTWFDQYPYEIDYRFNSRGFRDKEWPKDLQNAIWCLGDSATVGIGAPQSHSWPSQLAKLARCDTINLGIRAVDNFTISRLARMLIEDIRPKRVCILWSFLHRRPASFEHVPLSDCNSVKFIADDVDNFDFFEKCLNNITEVAVPNNQIIHGFVEPELLQGVDKVLHAARDSSCPKKVTETNSLNNFIKHELVTQHNSAYCTLELCTKLQHIVDVFRIQDKARDGHHWDIITNRQIAHNFSKHLQQ